LNKRCAANALRPRADEEDVSVFWENAERVLDAAVAAARSGQATEKMTVLIGNEGGIHIIAGSDWPLERLREERGAVAAYQVEHRGKTISVQGRQGDSTCLLETSRPDSTARRLLRDQPRYLIG
jgi:hypothetical protein